MAKRFIHIAFDFKSGLDSEEVEKTLDKAIDWINVASNCWLVWTSSSPEKWYLRLKKHLASEDQLFVCEVNIANRSGLMSPAFWEFIAEYQEVSSE
jgi:hypothetical protein